MSKPLHGILWLEKIENEIVPVGRRPSRDVGVGDLPDGKLEIHYLANADQALAFCIGVAQAGRNALTAVQGRGDVAMCVLLIRADELRPQTDDMEELIPLIAHSPVTKSQAKVTWETALDRFHSQAPNWLGNFKRINVIAQSPERLALLVRYYRWPDSEPVIQKSGVHRIDFIKDGDGLIAEWGISNMRAVDKMSPERARKWQQEAFETALRYGGREFDGNIRFPVNGELSSFIVDIAPSLSALNQLDFRAEQTEADKDRRTDPQVMRIAKALSKGATVLGRQPTKLQYPDGRTIEVSDRKFGVLLDFGAVEISGTGTERQYSYVGGDGFPTAASGKENELKI